MEPLGRLSEQQKCFFSHNASISTTSRIANMTSFDLPFRHAPNPPTQQVQTCPFATAPPVSCNGHLQPSQQLCTQCTFTHAVFLSEAAINLANPNLQLLVEQVREARSTYAIRVHGMHLCVSESFFDIPMYKLTFKYLGYRPDKRPLCSFVSQPNNYCENCVLLAAAAGLRDELDIVRYRCVISDATYSHTPFQQAWTPADGCTRTIGENEVCEACSNKFSQLAREQESSKGKDWEMWNLYFDIDERPVRLNKDMVKDRQLGKGPTTKLMEALDTLAMEKAVHWSSRGKYTGGGIFKERRGSMSK
ncbi:hypothetical protein P280DRAFT_527731 [Massarina eburnea CBS 473.64]|uniref:Uncharacterized protein n=1 Tax=Massarina eburnea CBS 473.64 TaxID=1395130 RepID=A0A6A6RV65_9PLEO|nr:hypothetical protein P280DRAFT_527731 [Massarina eburnea CBS 473.64]